MFGIVAAIVGSIAYALVIIITHIEIGWAAVGVGYMIGWAMKKGSNGLGGRRYQITAAVLTYLSVAMSFVPLVIHSAYSRGLGLGWSVQVWLRVFTMGLISPFLELRESMMGLITLFIIFVGIRFAWRSTAGRQVAVEGPFNTAG